MPQPSAPITVLNSSPFPFSPLVESTLDAIRTAYERMTLDYLLDGSAAPGHFLQRVADLTCSAEVRSGLVRRAR